MKFWNVVVALVVIGVLAVVGWQVWEATDDSDEPQMSESLRTGLEKIPARQRRVSVVFEEPIDTDTPEVSLRKQGRNSNRPPFAFPANETAESFAIVLSRPAPKGGISVRWTVVDTTPSTTAGSGPNEARDKWAVLLILTLASVGAGLAAYVFASRRKANPNAGQHDDGLEFASFLKVSALITISAIALVGVIITTKEDSENLAALFTLLGTIAGYLAGNKPTVEEDPGDGGAPPPPTDQATQPPASPQVLKPARRTVRRSLL